MPHILNFTSTLSPHLVERASNFMYELDLFAENFNVGRPGPGLLDSLFQGLWDGRADGEMMLDRLRSEIARTLVSGYSMTKEEGYTLVMTIILTALHLAVQALQADSEPDAYDYLSDARYLRGYADGVIYSGNDALIRADFARLGVKARHAETEEIKQRLSIWFVQNRERFTSVDSAALAATKQEPISFGTAQKWIREFKKSNKLQ
jgi:hypothetical protein